MVFLETEEFDKVHADCDRCLDIDPKFLKAYFRKAQAYREQLKDEAAIEILTKALEIEKENEDIQKLLTDVKTERELDTALPTDHPERMRFDHLLDWLKAAGS